MKDIYDDADITTDLLGFYSLLMSYVNIAVKAKDTGKYSPCWRLRSIELPKSHIADRVACLDRAEGPKHGISLMPRTDFKTLYKMYGDDQSEHKKNKCKRKKKDAKYEKLIEIVKHLAKKKGFKDSANVGKATFKWEKPKPQQAGGAPTPPIPRGRMKSACEKLVETPETVDWKAKWPTKDSDYQKGELSVESWLVFQEGKLDPLAIMERLLWDGQVGGLGDTVEKPLYPANEDAYGLFEIRDLSGGFFTDLEKFVTKVETQVKVWHHDPPQYPDLKKNNKRAVGGSCKKPDNDAKCKANQIEKTKGKCEDCPKGMTPISNVPEAICDLFSSHI